MSDRKRLRRIKEKVIIRDGLICCFCEKELTLEIITLDHIVPDSKRGTFNATNLTISCSECNNKRGNIPFFEYIKQFNFSKTKIDKYKKLYLDNLKIKVLNIAKEECLETEMAIPIKLIKKSCKILKIKTIDFSNYENLYKFEIKFDGLAQRKQIKYCFELLIHLIEAESY